MIMKRLSYILSAAILACTAFVTVYAQQSNLRTAYFLDGYTYRYKFNPALAPERGFFAIPAIGSVSLGAESNLGLSNFLYPAQDGKLAWFLDDSVSDEQFMSGLKDRNMLNINANINLFALGFRTGKSYHTLDVSLKVNERTNLPKSLFSFAKVGTASGNTSWQIADLGARADAYAEVAYGYSRSVGENLSVGGRFKFLLGMARADVMMEQMDLTIGRDKWEAKAKGSAEVSGPITLGTAQGTDNVDFDQITFPEDIQEVLQAPKSYGVALDLGASYNFLEYFTASLSLLDLGFISWNNSTTAVSPGTPWTFDGFGTIKTDGNTDFGAQFEQFGDDLLDMLQLQMTGKEKTLTKALSATLHAGIEARMPFYQRLTFGLLATHRFDGPFSWTEGRLSANLAPINCISLAASYGVSNFGSSAGAVVNFHFPGFNLYAGLDSFLPLTNLASNYIPVNAANTNLSMGLNITFGKAHGIYHDMKRAKKAARKAAESKE